MATYTTKFPGNLALEQHVWTLTIAEAKAARDELAPEIGTYWHENLTKLIRRAIRAKAATVTVYTAGFTTGELSNVLAAIQHNASF